MEAASTTKVQTPPKFEPNIDSIKQKLLKHNITPTPKIVRSIVKKQLQKHNRKLSKLSQNEEQLTPSQKQAVIDETHFQTIKNEYKTFRKSVKSDTHKSSSSGLLVGMPWERIERVKLREIASESSEFSSCKKLKSESLRELKQELKDGLSWVLDDDIEFVDANGNDLLSDEKELTFDPNKRRRNDKEDIQFLVNRLCKRHFTVKDWKLAKIMKQSGLRFSEGQLMTILEGLGSKGKWEQAMAVVEWVYNDKERKYSKSRFVYTKLLSVLKAERRPKEALRIFNLMREDCNIYPDMAAYHVVAVTLGQAGWLKDLLKIVECMGLKPSKRTNNMDHKHWYLILEPDIVIYNAILNACIPTQQWKGVSWVFQQLRKNGLKPNGATYGLAMEVMLNSGKSDLVHVLFGKMNRSGEAPKALTYKVLVRTFWEEGKINEAVEAVRNMEQRGVVGTGSVYYELACCLCNNGRWQDAMLEVKNMRKLRHRKPLEVTFTGMITSSLEGGHVDACISIFEHMKANCVPNIGTINIMLKVYGRNDLFSEAKQLFEEITGLKHDSTFLIPDGFTYGSMLEASASALQWEYFELVYKEMVLAGYQLDQSKHASLLVKASRAGKCHLLEHAFDAALEAGEVPHHLLFTEMVFQATAQQNYERAVILVNTLALAPFRISERQWMELFQSNRDKMSHESLENLLDALRNSDLVSEPTVANLSRTLHSLCGWDKSLYLSSSTGSNIDMLEGSCLHSRNKEIVVHNGLEVHHNEAVNNIDITCDDDSSSDGDAGIPETSDPQNYKSDLDGINNICTNSKSFNDDVTAGESSDFLGEPMGDFDEMEFEIPFNCPEADDFCRSKLPSADEILDAWKESRKSGLFLPYECRRKDISAPKNAG